MRGLVVLLYGLGCYSLFFGTFLYMVGFMGNVVVPKSIDSGAPGPVLESVLINLVLIALFALQHTIMARKGFKEVWTRFIPRAAERSTFVLLSSLLLLLLFWQWRPMPNLLWSLQDPNERTFAYFMFAVGWLTVLLSTFMINHFELFGLQQTLFHFLDRPVPGHTFKTTGLYRYVRHPIMTGFLVAFWATPDMTAGHLLFALGMTAYIVVGVRIEEKDLRTYLGELYSDYSHRVPAFFPVPGRSARERPEG